MSTLPDFTGPGYFAGESPDGLTTVAGVPVPADVRVYWRDPADPAAPDVLVAQTASAANGTWRIVGLNPDLQYVVRGRKAGFDDVSVVGAVPTRMDAVTATGSFATNEDSNGVDGMVLIEGGLPPYTIAVLAPLPFGLEPVIAGHELTVAGQAGVEDNGLWQSTLRVTASNGPWVDVAVQVEIVVEADPYWSSVTALLQFKGDLQDETGAPWSNTSNVEIGSNALMLTGGLGQNVRTSSNIFNILGLDFTVEFFLTLNAQIPALCILCEDSSRVFAVALSKGEGAFVTVKNNKNEESYVDTGKVLPQIGQRVHLAFTRKDGFVRIFFDGILKGSGSIAAQKPLVPETGSVIGSSINNYPAVNGSLEEFRVTIGIARYTENFTPPDKPFPSR